MDPVAGVAVVERSDNERFPAGTVVTALTARQEQLAREDDGLVTPVGKL